MNINWGVRFNGHNIQFLLRFGFALLVPILTYFGLSAEDLTSWSALGNVLLEAISNPFVVGFTVVNALNMIPDPTTDGLSDSEQARTYKVPKKN